MARLNETPSAADPLEILRRKFLRQNRDIARVNSNQSQRIRVLENEIARLHSENLEFRAEVLRLKNEAAENHTQTFMKHVDGTRSKLEAKLQEISTLVASLADTPSVKSRRTSRELQPDRIATARSPEQKKWKNMCALSEEVAAQEGRLPPILENKSYPRRTLDREEILKITPNNVAEATESPDIGPPPVSQFVNEDPVKIDLPVRSVVDRDETSDINPALLVNLEQRRKRKDSGVGTDHRRASRFEPQVQQGGQSLKVGAKRKMSVRDDDEESTTEKVAESSPDDFRFTRRNADETARSKAIPLSTSAKTISSRELAAGKKVSQDKKSTTPSTSVRRALGSKNANVDIANSPKKTAKAGMDEKLLIKESPNMEPKEPTEGRRPRTVLIRPIEVATAAPMLVVPESLTAERDQEPGTPEIPDLLSPISSQPSTTRLNSRDTPPPQDYGQDSETQRPSRRARASVSYAEPNLRDKMRRPTKDLIDAVTVEGKIQRLSITNQEDEPPTNPLKIKGEPEMDDSWKNMPTVASVDVYSKSPLVDKDVNPESTSSRLNHDQSMISAIDGRSERNISRLGSGSAISALMAGQRKVKHEAKEDMNNNEVPLENALSKLEIFEFTESTPLQPTLSTATAGSGEPRPSRGSRKLTHAPRNLDHVKDGDLTDTESGRMSGSSSLSRRRQSNLSSENGQLNVNLRVQRVESALKRSISSAGSVDVTDSTTRSERALGRRRSMML